MRIRELARRSWCALALAGMALAADVGPACAQDAPGRPVIRPNERANAAAPRQRVNVPPQGQQAQPQGATTRQFTYRPYVSGYYYPYSYGYPYPYYYGPGYGYGYSTGGPYYQYQVPNPYAFGSAFTYGYAQPGGYQYYNYYPW